MSVSTATRQRPLPTPKASPVVLLPHVQRLYNLAVQVGLSHEKGHRVPRLAQTNAFLMEHDKEPVSSWKLLREEDYDLLEWGLQTKALRWS